ncbi:hypothetical protein B4146_3282 [Bacillus subtilis]|nr:hypothetical protein B4146_3282 [Bacillus subtilis]
MCDENVTCFSFLFAVSKEKPGIPFYNEIIQYKGDCVNGDFRSE